MKPKLQTKTLDRETTFAFLNTIWHDIPGVGWVRLAEDLYSVTAPSDAWSRYDNTNAPL